VWLVLAGCGDSIFDPVANCSIPADALVDGGTDRSSIPALANPGVARMFDPRVGFIGLDERVIGIEFNGQPLAIPHQILWWHEVVNLAVPGQELTVTHSPLTGSSMIFDRLGTGVGEFTVSKYVVDSNLVLEDETGSLWPQLSRAARCGAKDGLSLKLVPHQEVTLRGWTLQHPDTWIVHRATGFEFLYTLYPYGDYEEQNARFLYPVGSVDPRLPAKERVLGVSSGAGGIALALSGLGQTAAAEGVAVWAENVTVAGEPIVVFWNSLFRGAVAYRSAVNGQELTFRVENGERVDQETGSIWVFDGQAIEGPLDGERLEPVRDAHVSFWFAWAKFQPATEVWSPPTQASIGAPLAPLTEALRAAALEDVEPARPN
jgi:hypothetical protein